MKCALCGFEFNREQAQAACRGCPVARGCRLVRCPNCGYETPAEAGIIKKLKSIGKGKDGTPRAR